MWGWYLGAAMAALAAGDAAVPPSLDGDVLTELNWARAHPQAYADELRAYRERFDGPIAYPDDAPDGVMTKEGVAAVDDAIAFLARQQAMPPLHFSPVLAGGADDLVADQGYSGRVGHYTAAGLNPGARVKRHGGDIYVGEVVAYGQPDARSIVRQLIVDDGVARRGHRALIYSPTYHYAGARCGQHASYGAMCVVDMAATRDGSPQLPGTTEPIAPLSGN